MTCKITLTHIYSAHTCKHCHESSYGYVQDLICIRNVLHMLEPLGRNLRSAYSTPSTANCPQGKLSMSWWESLSMAGLLLFRIRRTTPAHCRHCIASGWRSIEFNKIYIHDLCVIQLANVSCMIRYMAARTRPHPYERYICTMKHFLVGRIPLPGMAPLS